MSKNAKRSIDKTYHHDFINEKFIDLLIMSKFSFENIHLKMTSIK